MIIRFLLAALLLLSVGCVDRPLIIPADYAAVVESDFMEREVIPAGVRDSLRLYFTKTEDRGVKESLKFLYAYTPLSDLADYPVQFFVENVKMSLRAKDEMPWGRYVPMDIFLHYVMPVRVNNENLDDFRMLMYNELKERIIDKDVTEAVLEINRWCHEKVTYQPSDIRTSSPLATMLSARGRCGEESTFTVAALRTAGIPARQVYTPRWAHTDDNHAWVEVWIEGEWFYLGACEPELVLDRGWFTEPARRAMLVHTKAFGAYMGNEKVIVNEKRFAEINNLAKYAETKVVTVQVNDDGKPVSGVNVEFCLYNYAEFYPIAKVRTNEEGFCSFETGLGDLLISAGLQDKYGYKIVSVGDTDTLTIDVQTISPEKQTAIADLYPPAAPEPLPGPGKEMIEKNQRLLVRGDSIRNAYISSWISMEEAIQFANEYGYSETLVPDLIISAHGNYKEIMTFLKKNADRGALALELLKQISAKDLRDTRAEVLSDHLAGASGYMELYEENELPLFYDYVLNPRIANEMLTPWRQRFKERFAGKYSYTKDSDISYFSSLIGEIAALYDISEEENHYLTPVTPSGALNVNTLDSWSLRIFTVAFFRNLGIPARLESGTNRPQYYHNGTWHSVWFPGEEMITGDIAVVSLKYDGKDPEPEYYVHFTLARYEKGRYNTLSYEYNRKVSHFRENLNLYPGNYLLVTGSRSDNNLILASLEFFSLQPGESIELDVSPRREPGEKGSYGMLGDDIVKRLKNVNRETGSTPDMDSEVVAIWLNPVTEPAVHLLKDLSKSAHEFESWKGVIRLFVSESADSVKLSEMRDRLPSNCSITVDKRLSFYAEISESAGETGSPALPYVLLINPGGNIIYKSAGYQIGTAAMLIGKTKRTDSPK